MTPVSDSDLSNVTGQAGVNINADLLMNISIGTMAWGDSTGVDSHSSYWAADAGAGYVGITGFNITNLRIKARETDNYGTGYTGAGTVTSGSYNTLLLKPITIDVSSGAAHGGATYVRFGLGSLQITMDALSFAVELGPTTGLGEELGTVNLGPMEVYINPGSYVDTYNNRGAGTSGVTTALNVIVDQLTMSYVSWGDSDGLPGGNVGAGGCVWMAPGTASTAGYIGLNNLVVGGPITITGEVAIDVVTSSIGIYSHNVTPTTVCHISFPSNFNVFVTGPITALVQLDGTAALSSANAGTLGDIYISGFGLNIVSGSWVDIWAH